MSGPGGSFSGFSGLMREGTVPSALSTRKLLKPPIVAPPGAKISSALTVMLAVAFAEIANTDRATPECAATLTSSVLVGSGSGVGSGVVLGACTNEANPPPAGWLEMVSRKLLVKFV